MLWHCPGDVFFDLYLVTVPDRCRGSLDAVTHSVAEGCGIASNLGKTGVIGAIAGAAPPGVAELGPDVWRGDKPPNQRGMVVLGSPVGHPDFIAAWTARRVAQEQELLEHLPLLPDLQCAWLLLALCASLRANHALRTVPPPDDIVGAAGRGFHHGGHPPGPSCLLHCQPPWGDWVCSLRQGWPRRHTGPRGRTPCRSSRPDSRTWRRSCNAIWATTMPGALPMRTQPDDHRRLGRLPQLARPPPAARPQCTLPSRAPAGPRRGISFRGGGRAPCAGAGCVQDFCWEPRA